MSLSIRDRKLSLPATLRRMVDPDYGLAHRFVELGANPLAPDVFVTCVEGGAGAYMVDHAHPAWANCSNASGAAYGRTDACWATIGELAERYCAAIYDRSIFLHSTAEALSGAAMPVENMILFSEAQYQTDGFAFKPYSTSQSYAWQCGTHLNSSTEIFVPAQLLYLSYEWADQMLMQTVSTGLACHSDPDAACLSAVLELIERDGFAAAWALGMGLPRLELSTAERLRLSLETQNALDNDTLRVTLYGLPNEFGIANIVAVVEHVTLGFGAVGAAAALSPFKAIEKAVLEAQHTWIGLSLSMEREPPKARAGKVKSSPPDPSQIKTPHDHAQHYMHPDSWAELSWFLSGERMVSLAELCEEGEVSGSRELVKRLHEHGFDTYLFDLTTDDIRSLGLKVVRALVPGLQPLCFGAGLLNEDRRRLTFLSKLWDWPMPDTLTRQPHPFP